MRKLLAPMAIGSVLAAGVFSIPGHACAQESKLVAPEPPESDIHQQNAQFAYEAGDIAASLTELEAAYRTSGRSDDFQRLRAAHQAEGDAAVAALGLRCYATGGDLAPPAECIVQPTDATPPAPVTADVAPVVEPQTDVPPPAPRDQTGITVAWILSATGAATILGATAVGFSAEGTHSTLDDRCGPMRTMCPTGFESDRDRGITLSLVADVLGFGGAAILGTGIALLFLFQEDEAPPVTAACGPEGCMATARGSF